MWRWVTLATTLRWGQTTTFTRVESPSSGTAHSSLTSSGGRPISVWRTCGTTAAARRGTSCGHVTPSCSQTTTTHSAMPGLMAAECWRSASPTCTRSPTRFSSPGSTVTCASWAVTIGQNKSSTTKTRFAFSGPAFSAPQRHQDDLTSF